MTVFSGSIQLLRSLAGLSRQRALAPQRATARASRMYAAAKMGRLTADWIMSGVAPREEIFSSIRAIRSRARALERDNDHARKFLGQVTTNVVGRGVMLQVKAADANGAPDTAANTMLEQSWKQWGKVGNCTVDKRKSWGDLQRLAIRSVARDGEFIIRMLPGWKGNAWRFALQVIDPALLDENYTTMGGNGKPRVVMGIELDEWNAPVAYYFRTDYDRYNRIRVPAEQIIHLYIEEVDGQIRAVTWMCSAMIRMHHLAGYEEASVVAARAGACKMGFFTTPAGEDYNPDEHEDDKAPVNEAAPGMFEQLPSGWDFKSYDPAHPQTQFGDYCKAQLRTMASGLQVAYHTFANDLEGVNFSSGRLGTLDERDVYMVLQDWLIEHLHTCVWEGWLTMALLSQAVPLPYSKFAKFNAPHWQPRRWSWVDPLKDVKAKQLEKAEGWNSDSAICTELGREFEDVMASRERDRATRQNHKEPEDAEPTN